MAKKYSNAVKQAKLHKEELVLINEDMPIALVHSWEAMITAWENDRSSPNPYYTPTLSKCARISNMMGFSDLLLQEPRKVRCDSALHSKRRRSKQDWGQVALTAVRAQGFFCTDWISNTASMFSLFSIKFRWLTHLQAEIACRHCTT